MRWFLMTEVIIDGVEYIPSTDVKVQVGIMREVLESIGYLSSTAIDEIISKFEEFPEEKPQKITNDVLETEESCHENMWRGKHWANKELKFGKALKPYQIEWVYPNGTLKLERGHRSKWKIQDAIEMHEKYHDGLTYSEFNKIVDESWMSKTLISRILYSLVHGDLVEWIEKWKRMNTPTLNPPKKIPIQNNPEKRKELGYGGIP